MDACELSMPAKHSGLVAPPCAVEGRLEAEPPMDPRCAKPTYAKPSLVNGKPCTVECVDILGQTYEVARGLATTVSLEDEWYEDVRNPEQVASSLADDRLVDADIFTFWQRPPDSLPRFGYKSEWVDTAVLPVTSYENWWNHQIKARVRNLIRKSEKDGLRVVEAAYDDQFVLGMTKIFNESPVRQGRRFWHFGKDFQTVKSQFARFVHREQMLAAYRGDEMVGFMMLGNAGRFALTGQIISSLNSRDLYPNNALIAKAVEVCARRAIPNLCYLYWGDDSLTEFKRRCGFERIRVPRYFVPLSLRGRLALAAGLHHGIASLLPAGLKARLKGLRQAWYEKMLLSD
jgi:hypothetical protein